MGFFSKLFKKDDSIQDSIAEPVHYNGFVIYPEPIHENGQYRVAGRICLSKDNDTLTHTFIRSDVLNNIEDAQELMISKSKLFIDQSGEDIF